MLSSVSEGLEPGPLLSADPKLAALSVQRLDQYLLVSLNAAVPPERAGQLE